NAAVDAYVFGGAGQDLLNFTDLNHDIEAAASLMVYQDGGLGADTIDEQFTGKNNGHLTLKENESAGTPLFQSDNLSIEITTIAGSRGHTEATIDVAFVPVQFGTAKLESANTKLWIDDESLGLDTAFGNIDGHNAFTSADIKGNVAVHNITGPITRR